MPLQHFSPRQYLRELQSNAIKALIAALILGFLDFYIAYLFVDISMRPLMLFFLLYGVGSLAIAMVFGTAIHFVVDENRRSLFFNISYMLFLAFCLNFVYINIQFFKNFTFDNLIGMQTNLTLLACTVAAALFVLRSKKINGLVSNTRGFSLVSALIFGLLGYINFFVLNWSSPLQNAYSTLLMTILMTAIPVLCLYFVVFFRDALNLFFKKAAWSHKVLLPASVLIVALMIPQIIRFPLLGGYEDSSDEKIQSAHANRNDSQPNIIWIVMDTARRDRMSCYGHEGETTPNLEKFREDGVTFLDAISSAPWTMPSHASMFTGTFPSKHGAHFSDEGSLKHPLVNENITISEILRENGYKTAAFISNYAALSRTYGFGQGFDLYYDVPSRFLKFYWGQIFSRIYPAIRNKEFLKINRFLLSSEINPIALHWMEKNKKSNFFLFINYMECHAGYNYLPGKFSKEFDRRNQRALKLQAQMDKKEIAFKKRDITPSEHEVLISSVDTRLKYLDHNLGKLFEALKKMKLYDDALIIVTSDHGSLWGEHNSFGHMADLYNELINIPLIIKYPYETNKKGISRERVQSIDIMAEILSFLNIRAHKGIQGQPFNNVIHSIIAEVFRSKNSKTTKLSPERFYRDLKAIYSSDGTYKYIQSSNGQSMLFDLVEDPSEQNNLFGQMPELAKTFDNKLSEWQKSITPMVDESTIKKIDKEKLERDLRSLGYIK